MLINYSPKGRDNTSRNIFATKKQAEASLALAMLTQQVKDANGDWKPNWMQNFSGTGDYQWVVEFKWYEGVGQALYYSMSTGKGGGLVLIAKNDKWKKYTDRAKATILHYDLPFSLGRSQSTLVLSGSRYSTVPVQNLST
jgi:hypothetical protein